MRAFVISGPHQAALVETDIPTPGPGEALVRVLTCGICGSDLHAYEGTQPFFRFPEVPGHEVVGEIVKLVPRPGGPLRLLNRPLDEGLAEGTRVVLDPAMPCGRCHPCTHGRYNCCENMRVVGVHAPGALAQFYTAPLECLHRVPEDMSQQLAALVEPVSIGVQATGRARIADSDTVLVIGAGTIGLCVMMVAKARGARVVMSDISGVRRQTAVRLGADLGLDPRATDFVPALQDFCGATGPEVVVEAVGKPATVSQALDLVVAGGRVVLLGLVSEDIHLPGSLMVRKELDFMGSRLHGGTIPEAVRMLREGLLDPTPLVTQRIGLDRSEQGLRMMFQTPDEVLKVLVEVSS